MKTALTLLALCVPVLAIAHPDHSAETGFNLVHFLTDPFHLAAAALVASPFVVAVCWRRRGSSRSSR